jgi:hypothetical protein
VKRRTKWIVGGVVALALAGLAVFVLVPLKAPPTSPPPDTRVTLRLEAYHDCELRLIASLPKETDLNVRALRRGRRSSTEIGSDTFRVVGYFEGHVFGAESHGEYQCLVRHPGAKDYELMQLRMHPEPPYPHK